MKNILRLIKHRFVAMCQKYIILSYTHLYRLGLHFQNAHLAYPYIQISKDLIEIPGFTHPNERRYLKLFSSYIYKDKGFICELGSTFGSLTASLASGLSKGSRRIQSYDIFTWHKSFGGILDKTQFKNTLEDGESFKHLFDHYTSKYADRIEVHANDINNVIWEEGKKIEFLLVDAMKTETLADSILKNFYKHLEKGSFVFQQDFCHFHEPWIHLIHYEYKNYFDFICHIEDTPSVVFRLNKKIETEKLHKGFSLLEFSEKQIEDSFDYSASLITQEPAKQNILAAKIYCFLICHFFEKAEHSLNNILCNYNFIESGNLEYVIRISEQVKKDKELIIDKMRSCGKNLLTDLDYITNVTHS